MRFPLFVMLSWGLERCGRWFVVWWLRRAMTYSVSGGLQPALQMMHGCGQLWSVYMEQAIIIKFYIMKMFKSLDVCQIWRIHVRVYDS